MKRWSFAQSRLCGLAHVRDNRLCQDAVDVQKKDSCVAAALADGIGSLPNSDVAAQAATRAATRWLLEHSAQLAAAADPAALISSSMLASVAEKIKEAARLRLLPVETMDCNLAFVCIIPSHDLAVYGALGDCAVCVLDGHPRVLTEHGGTANATSSVLYAHGAESFRINMVTQLAESLNGFILASDGLDGEIYRKNSAFVRQSAAAYFNTIFEEDPNQALKSKLISLQRTDDDAFDDDLSMVVLSQASAPIVLAEDPRWLCKCGHRNSLTNSYCEACRTDFLELYPRSILSRFSSLDDSIRFFNQNEPEARAMLGMPEDAAASAEPEAAPTQTPPDDAAAQSSENAADPAGLPRPAERTNRTETVKSDKRKAVLRRNRSLYLSIAIILVVLCIVFALTEAFSQLWPTAFPLPSVTPSGTPSYPTDDFYARPQYTVDGNYLGEASGNLPEGFGVLEHEGYFWIGVFRDGIMTGEFLAISTDDPSERITLYFPDDPNSTDAPFGSDIPYVVTVGIDSLLQELSPDSRKLNVGLSPGDRVYRTGSVETAFQERIYVQIVTENGTTGWCEAACIEPAGA